jgi:hypothetical protein
MDPARKPARVRRLSRPGRWSHSAIPGLDGRCFNRRRIGRLRFGGLPCRLGEAAGNQRARFLGGNLNHRARQENAFRSRHQSLQSLTTKVSKEDAFPLRVRIPAGTCGLERDSDVLVDQILAWDNSLFHKELGLLPDGLIEQVTAALKDFLDI